MATRVLMRADPVSTIRDSAGHSGEQRDCLDAACVGICGVTTAIAIALQARYAMSPEDLKGNVSFDIDDSFGPHSEQADPKVYVALSAFCSGFDPELLSSLGLSMTRWLYLHAIYRLPKGSATCLHVPSYILSLACGLIVFLAVFSKSHRLDGNGLLDGCEAWLVTVREANRVANEIRNAPRAN